MALRLRRDVQKASYYVWFLGAEEAIGLRGERVINSVLPYLIDRSRRQEPLKVTLQVSHKGIKILQGSSKYFIPHSAITSSVQTDDIVACVLLLYNPATKCSLHVHAYRCDSESTAEALHQQLQILINRSENQKRFDDLENRLGIMPPVSKSSSSTAINGNKSSSSQMKIIEYSQKQHHQAPHQQKHLQQQRRNEVSPKRFSSSLGSDTGNSTRESECSEELSGSSPISHSPSINKPLPQPNNDLFDSLAAELRAKLNGNGPPILLPPRDYDTVHRSKGNLTAIELRRCRNSLIVGAPNATSSATATVTATGKQAVQVSSRGSSGIGSDLAPSPERQDLHSSSDDEHWSNDADNSVIALKPSQIQKEHSAPITAHHPQLNRKSAVKQPEDSYLRDLPAKPYNPPSHNNIRDINPPCRREDEIKPKIVRPSDYDAKFCRVLQAEKRMEYQRSNEGKKDDIGREAAVEVERTKICDKSKYNEINRLLNKQLSLEGDLSEKRYKNKSVDMDENYNDSGPSIEHKPVRSTSNYRNENLTDKQKFIEYSAKKQSNAFAKDEAALRYGGRHRYADPADLPFEQPTTLSAAHNKYAAVHCRTNISPDRSDLGHRTTDREQHRERRSDGNEVRHRSHEREGDRRHSSRSKDRNPYQEPESIPYIKSMEIMMKSSAMRYKSFDGVSEPKDEKAHIKLSQRSKSYPKQDNEKERNYIDRRPEYSTSSSSINTPRENYKEAKEKFRSREHMGGGYDHAEDNVGAGYKTRHRGTEGSSVDAPRRYEGGWSDDEERYYDMPESSQSEVRSHSRARDDHWKLHENNMRPRDEERNKRNHRVYERSQVSNTDKLSDSHKFYPRDSYEYPATRRDYMIERGGRRDYTPPPPERQRPIDYSEHAMDNKKRISANGAVPHPNSKNISNLTKGYRHSYAEPVPRSAGRVGLAAVNPY